MILGIDSRHLKHWNLLTLGPKRVGVSQIPETRNRIRAMLNPNIKHRYTPFMQLGAESAACSVPWHTKSVSCQPWFQSIIRFRVLGLRV